MFLPTVTLGYPSDARNASFLPKHLPQNACQPLPCFANAKAGDQSGIFRIALGHVGNIARCSTPAR